MTLHTNGLKSEATLALGVTSVFQISFFTTTFEAIWYELHLASHVDPQHIKKLNFQTENYTVNQ